MVGHDADNVNARPMYHRVVPDARPCTEQGGDMGEKPFIKFYPSDFLGGTSGLSPAERGVYMTLLCLIYEADGPIPRDDARLARRCGSPKAAFIRAIDCLIDQGKIPEYESLEDSFKDLANYAIIGLLVLRGKWDRE